MSLHSSEKKHLSARGMLAAIRKSFDEIIEPRTDQRGLKRTISLTDCLMSGLAVFGLKLPSLLQFDQGLETEIIQHNLKTLYEIQKAPSDTYMRERLDKVDPQELRKAFLSIFSLIQRGKVLEEYRFLDEYVLVACDGTGMFSSESIHCPNCCEKHHREGKITYYHQMLAGVVIHPDHKEVFPLCPEPIFKTDGATKNDCEQNALKRFLEQFHKEHPHLSTVFTYDALGAKVPYLRSIIEAKSHFIVNVNSNGNPSLFEWIKGIALEKHTESTSKEIIELSFYNGVPLNDSHPDFQVNFIDCTVKNLKGKVASHFSWVTDLHVTKKNVFQISRGGRARWRIENETFNTLKNQGYHFEHNFGHGYQHLCHVLGRLMFLAFLVDQVQQHCCGLFQAAVKQVKSKKRFWRRQQCIIEEAYVPSWEDLFLWFIDRSGKISFDSS